MNSRTVFPDGKPSDWYIGPGKKARSTAKSAPTGSDAVLTPEQLKAKFEAEGRSFAEWARANGYSTVAVYRVINGFTKAKRGQGHEIAVALGLKAT